MAPSSRRQEINARRKPFFAQGLNSFLVRRDELGTCNAIVRASKLTVERRAVAGVLEGIESGILPTIDHRG
jgi:hypothetical protein